MFGSGKHRQGINPYGIFQMIYEPLCYIYCGNQI
jgi:hypothetical protein